MKTHTVRLACVLGVVFGLAFAAGAQQADNTFRFANIFNDNMVLQCDKPVRLWGWAKPGSEVTLTIETEKPAPAAPADAAKDSGQYAVTMTYVETNPPAFKTQQVTAKADGSGKWLVTLKPMPAGFAPRVVRDVRRRRADDLQRADRRSLGDQRPEQHDLAQLLRQAAHRAGRDVFGHPVFPRGRFVVQAARRPEEAGRVDGLHAADGRRVLRDSVPVCDVHSPLPEGAGRYRQQRPRRDERGKLDLASGPRSDQGPGGQPGPRRLRQADVPVGNRGGPGEGDGRLAGDVQAARGRV